MTWGARVLHVDDDPDFAALTARSLEREEEGLTVDTAGGGDEALEAIAGDDYDCVVSDYEMPGMDGLDLLEAVRDDHDHLPFVLFTATGSEDVASEAISMGVTGYLRKGTGGEQFAVLANRVRNAVESYRARTRLRRRDRRLQALLEHSNDRLFVLDEENRYEWVSPAIERLTGHDPEELLGVHSTEQVHPEDREQVRRNFERVKANPEGIVTHEYRVRHRDGSWRWVETIERNRLDDPAIEGVVVNSRDVTERKERERELERERDRFEALFETIPEPAVRLSDPDGGGRPIVRSVNPAFERAFGYGEDELVGESLNEFIVPPDRREEAERLDLEAGDESPLTVEVRRRTADGELRDFLLVNTVVSLPGEEDWEEGLTIYADITDQKRYERELERQNERLDEFASIVSHDLRNPLTVADGRLALAREDCESEHLDVIGRMIDRMEALIEELLTLAREGVPVGEIEPIDLENAVTECWRAAATDEATLVTETNRVLRADPVRFRQLLENLIRNAIDHGGEGVTVTVGDLDDPAGFYVADDGPGLPECDRERVFESGYSTTEEGTGIGLAIVAEIAEAHGWRMDVSESADGGARFEITGVRTTTG